MPEALRSLSSLVFKCLRRDWSNNGGASAQGSTWNVAETLAARQRQRCRVPRGTPTRCGWPFGGHSRVVYQNGTLSSINQNPAQKEEVFHCDHFFALKFRIILHLVRSHCPSIGCSRIERRLSRDFPQLHPVSHNASLSTKIAPDFTLECHG